MSAERTESTRFTIFGFVCLFVRILDPFEACVCSYFLDLVGCFFGAREASGAHSKTFGFVRILGLFEDSGFSHFCIWFVVFVERTKLTEPTRELLSLFEWWVCSHF